MIGALLFWSFLWVTCGLAGVIMTNRGIEQKGTSFLWRGGC